MDKQSQKGLNMPYEAKWCVIRPNVAKLAHIGPIKLKQALIGPNVAKTGLNRANQEMMRKMGAGGVKQGQMW